MACEWQTGGQKRMLTSDRWFRTQGPLDVKELRWGRVLLLILLAGLVVGAGVEPLRSIPDPDLFSARIGSIVAGVVTGATMVGLIDRRPAWLRRTDRVGSADGAGDE